MVVPIAYEFTRETPRLGLTGDRFAAQPFSHSPEVFTLLALVGQLQSKVNELEGQRQHLSAELDHLNNQVRGAVHVQRAMLPTPVAMPGVEIRTLYRPVESLGGDLYDFAPIDERHLALCLADACGHGLPAALVGAFLKHAFRGVETGDGLARMLEPAQVLRNVNRDLLASNFEDGQFVTGLDAVYDAEKRTLRFARGGMSYPILLREGEKPRQLVTAGPLMGAVDSAHFESMTVELQSGDCVLFHTDGLDALLCDHGRRGVHATIAATPWFTQLEGRTCDAILADLHDRLDATRPEDWPADDVTVIALCVK